jgi:hypothetical protein
MHQPVSSSASSTSSQEMKDRRNTSKTRSCASAPATPLKSLISLDFSDGEEHCFPRVAGPPSYRPSNPLRLSTHTDNESEPKRGRGRGIKDHSSRRILFDSGKRNSISTTRPVPPPVMIFDSPCHLPDVESLRSPADSEQTATIFTTEPEEILTADDPLSSAVPGVQKRASWKSKLFSKPRAATTDQSTAGAEVSPATPTPNTPTPSSSKDKENSFLRMFGANRRHSTSSTVVSSEQSTGVLANDAEAIDSKKKSTLRKFGKKSSSRKDAPDDPCPKDAKPPLPHASTLSLPTPTSPCSVKLCLTHAATFGHGSKSISDHHSDALSTSQPHPPTPPTPSKQQNPKEPRNGPGYSGMHTLLHPIQACQAHLYNVHGIGSGPATLDLLMPTPIPKGGVKRTDPYAELGMARVPAAVNVGVKAARRASVPSVAEVQRERGEQVARAKSDL